MAFTIIMLVWTISDYISKKTKSILSSLFVASILFLIGFKTQILPVDLLPKSSLLALAQTVIGFIIVHIGTMISTNELKKQWKTVLIGIISVLGIAVAMFTASALFFDINYVIAAIGAISGGAISIIIVQEAALEANLYLVAAFPVLISALQGIIGFPLTSIILRKEAKRLQQEYRQGNLNSELETKENVQERKLILPEVFQTTPGTLFIVGIIVVFSAFINNITGGLINKFIVALLLGIFLRAVGILKPNVLTGIDAFGLMMLAILIIIFDPLATISISALSTLIYPILIACTVGILGNIIFATIAGRLLGYSFLMSIAVGLTALYGFPGTMILSEEAAKSVGESEEEVNAIKKVILPKMIIAGFATVTITSVFITSILAGFIQ